LGRAKQPEEIEMRIHKPHLFERHGEEDGAQREFADDSDAPLPDYDRIPEKDLVEELHKHTQAELAEIEAYERGHQSRTRVLNKLHYLRQREPVEGYDQMNAEEIEEVLKQADLQTIDNIRAYERKFRDRPLVLDAIKEIRPREAAKEPAREGYQHTSYGPSVAHPAPSPGELAANKALVTIFYAEVVNSRDLDAMDRLLSDEFIHNGHVRHRSDQREEFRKLLDAFPDLQTEIELILAEGDLVAVHQRWAGTHGGSDTDLEHGQRVEFTSTAVIRVQDEQITEAWDEVDLEGLADLFTDGS
jgi:predicted ester cyclase